ncbi:MAG: nicotinate-nucleotide adenylyltransferase [Leptospirales bacterium]|nr:nicotinate-nucleotide adenylyltransferase [Leptospirales bacterium]
MVRSDNKKRIGIFGGTFNPIHHGHLINIALVKENFSLDLIFFVPVKDPVHKLLSANILPGNRMEMVKLAIAEEEHYKVLDIEIKRESPSYTITTLEELKKIYCNDDLFLIIGSDSFNELDIWKEYKKILSDYTIIVLQRPGDTELRDDILSIAKRVEFQKGYMIEISSSMIRDRVKKNLPIKFFTTDKVVSYIRDKGLYKN